MFFRTITYSLVADNCSAICLAPPMERGLRPASGKGRREKHGNISQLGNVRYTGEAVIMVASMPARNRRVRNDVI